MIIYTVVGYRISCPSETWQEGNYKSVERAEQAIAKAKEDYSKCEFYIDTNWMEDDDE